MSILDTMKAIPKTLNKTEQLEFCKELLESMGNKLPDYFGRELQSSDNNSKTGFTTVNNPALLTCLIGLSCNGLCYACNGYYRLDSVEIPRVSNLYLHLIDPDSYRVQVKALLMSRRIVRFNDSGDLVDYNQLEMIYQLAIETRCNVQIFTKKHFMVEMLCRKYGETNTSLIEKGIYIMYSADPKITNIPRKTGFKIADIAEDNETIKNGDTVNGEYTCKKGQCHDCYVNGCGCFDKTGLIKTVRLTVHGVSKAAKEEYFND